MNLYKISQSANNDYDTYDSAIVAAENEEEARKINPCKYDPYRDWETDRKSTRLNSSHSAKSRMPSSA